MREQKQQLVLKLEKQQSELSDGERLRTETRGSPLGISRGRRELADSLTNDKARLEGSVRELQNHASANAVTKPLLHEIAGAL